MLDFLAWHTCHSFPVVPWLPVVTRLISLVLIIITDMRTVSLIDDLFAHPCFFRDYRHSLSVSSESFKRYVWQPRGENDNCVG